MIPLDVAIAGAILTFLVGACFGSGITAIIVARREDRQDGAR